ncbi:dTDP-4-dehydrorhamnose 3,5-epimerase [Massilia horti]|uniref:dTDP-4-dehydrorhamnose 3,5-epimerase n=1 Tax=Massilia horti TaxID=2562153 RepID=A0A4Y9T3M4_9BURK|nr:dTDP-4-dehydrorhamnose 3,5-epimerase [Massilia horti]TFW33989.1 dTDP-4-dehydrorhamnose 3,5-epimerase [Massilia horti]
MKLIQTALPEVLVFEPQVFGDERGFFFESFNVRRFADLTGLHPQFVQDNHSRSAQNVVRGLHYQVGRPQAKLIRVVAGSVFDVVVDMRRAAPTFGRAVVTELSAENRRQIWVPPGFAHGFLATSDHAECLYKTTDYWSPENERTLMWNDPALGIDWPLSGAPIVSPKDREGRPFALAEAVE